MKLLLLFSFILNVFNSNPTTDVHSRKVDVKASTIAWTGHKVTGKHNGFVAIKSGEVALHDGVLSSGTFTMDMTSITCTDLTGEYSDKLVNHLKSEDFFNSASFPTATLKITRAIPQGTDGTFKVQADLTIKGITKPIKFFAKISNEGGKEVATADIKVDRSEFDIRYGSGSFFDNLGDKTIYDEFDLNVKLVIK